MGDSRLPKKEGAQHAAPESGVAPKSSARARQSVEPATMDPTLTVSLVFRRADAASRGALARNDEARLAELALAAADIAAAYREAADAAAMKPVRWQQLGGVVGSLGQASQLVRAALQGQGVDSVVEDLQAAEQAFDTAQPDAKRAASGSGAAVTAKPLATAESIQLCRQAMAAASERVQGLLATKGAEIQTDALAVCAALPLHVNVARDTALSIVDRRARIALAGDVESLSASFDQLAELLSMKPRLAWNTAFAATFDAENALRSVLGLANKSRPYSGVIDPEAAKAAVISGGDKRIDTDSLGFQDPQSAISGLGAALRVMFASRDTAITNFGDNMKEPPDAPPESWAETLIMFGIKVAISTATAGTADFVAEHMASRFEARQLGKLGDAVRHLSESERVIVEQQLKSLPHAGQWLAINTAKSGLEVLLKDSTVKALEDRNKPESFAKRPINVFVQQQQQVISSLDAHASAGFAKLSPALAQLDLDTLNALAVAFNNQIADVAHARQYASTMAAWENMRAEAELASKKTGKKSGDSVDVQRIGVAGVLEAQVDVDSDPAAGAVRLRALRLNDAEPAALEFYRRSAIPLRDVGLHVLHRVRMSDLGEFGEIVFSAGPGGRLQLTSISRRDLRTLKIYASRDRVRGGNFFAAAEGEYDHVPDSAAVHVAHQFMNRIAHATTADVEES